MVAASRAAIRIEVMLAQRHKAEMLRISAALPENLSLSQQSVHSGCFVG
jgi:hypothetical protein